MTRNKVLGSSAPHAVFVFGGSGAPCLPDSPGPQGVVGGHAPLWEVVRAGGCHWPKAFPLGRVRLATPPVCSDWRGLGVPPTPSSHGVSAPAPLRAGPGHRFRGSLRGGLGCRGHVSEGHPWGPWPSCLSFGNFAPRDL